MSVFYDAIDPNKFIRDVKILLKKDGVLLEFADLASIVKNKMFDTICHEHLEYYSSKVIINLCKKNKLRVFDIKSNDINGASKQYYICHQISKYEDNDYVINKIINEEKKLNLSKYVTYKKFIKDINYQRNKLVNFLKKERKKGRKIHCYGASTKGNVLLQYYNIKNNLIDFVAERNKNKYNLFTPGTKIKIISEVLSRFYKPQYYLVLPWHFKRKSYKRKSYKKKKELNLYFRFRA